MLVVTEANLDNKNIKRISPPCDYTAARCVAGFRQQSIGSGSSFTAPQVSAMLSNLYAVWPHLWPADDPSTTDVNEATPQKLVALVLECAQTANPLGGTIDNLGAGYVSYECLTSPVGTVRLPSGYALPAQELTGGIVVAGATILGSRITIFDKYLRDFPYDFSAPAQRIRPLWQQHLFEGMASHHASFFADTIEFEQNSVSIVHDKKEARLMVNHAWGIFAALGIGERGGNDFHGSGSFNLKENVALRIGYHKCHALTQNTCLMLHASWEEQRIKGTQSSLVERIKAQRYDLAVGMRLTSSSGMTAFFYGSYHSPLEGHLALKDRSLYAIGGGEEWRVGSQIKFSW